MSAALFFSQRRISSVHTQLVYEDQSCRLRRTDLAPCLRIQFPRHIRQMSESVFASSVLRGQTLDRLYHAKISQISPTSPPGEPRVMPSCVSPLARVSLDKSHHAWATFSSAVHMLRPPALVTK